MKYKSSFFLTILFLLSNLTSKTQNFHLLKDINTSTGSSPLNIKGTYLYFGNNFGSYDIQSEIYETMRGDDFYGRLYFPYAIVGDTVLFTISNGVSLRSNLWRSNGTTTGTSHFAVVGNSTSEIKSVSGGAYYIEYLNHPGALLWVTDGTEAGTYKVDSNLFNLIDANAISFKNNIYYPSNNLSGTQSLWKYDAQKKEKTLVHEFPATALGPLEMSIYSGGDYFYTIHADTDSIHSLWRSDGDTILKITELKSWTRQLAFTKNKIFANNYITTTSGSYRAIEYYDSTTDHFNFLCNADDGSTGHPYQFHYTYLNNILCFIKIDSTYGYSLWRTDGTDTGTYMIKDLYDGDDGKTPANYLLTSGDHIFFTDINTRGGYDLWATDGTVTGTYMLHPSGTDTKASIFSPADVNGTLYFSLYTNEFGFEPWKSDGTVKGTIMVKDIYPGVASSTPNSFTFFKDSVLFSANDGIHGLELFISDGTATGTRLFQDLNTTVNGSSMRNYIRPIQFKNKLFFFAEDAEHGSELWQTDGTEAGTTITKDMRPGILSSGADESLSISFDSTLYYSTDAAGSLDIPCLWKTNGIEGNGDSAIFISTNGKIKNITGAEEYYDRMINVNGRLAFRYNDSIFITNKNRDSAFIINMSDPSSRPAFSRGDTLVFFNGSGYGGNDSLYAYNSKAGNTSRIAYFVSYGSYGNKLLYPNKAVNTTYFTILTSDDYFLRSNLMCSNGTASGTVDLNIQGYADMIRDRYLYFSGNRSYIDKGNELYKTNGTISGTSLVKDINTGYTYGDDDTYDASSFPHCFTLYKDSIYFFAMDSTERIGLWVTDGTSANTHFITYPDFENEIFDATMSGVVNGLMVFSTTVGKILQSDGTAEGTYFVPDEVLKHISTGNSLTVFNNQIFIPAYDSLTGTEMWVGLVRAYPKPEFLSLTGYIYKGDTKLEWKVNNDSLIEHYEIERSLDNINFETIGNTTSNKGTGIQTYSTTDANVSALGKAIIYYRIKEIFEGGTIHYSNAIALSVISSNNKDNNFIVVIPNPFTSQLRLLVNTSTINNASILITDATGKRLAAMKQVLPLGVSTLTFNTTFWKQGTYFISAVLNDGTKLHAKAIKLYEK